MQQTSFELSRAMARAECGMNSARTHAERDTTGWTHKALEALRGYAQGASAPFTIERARMAIAAQVPTPPEKRAWGSITRMAIALDIIQFAGTATRAVSSNGAFKPEYVAGRGAR
jgi:hypothetical protein